MKTDLRTRHVKRETKDRLKEGESEVWIYKPTLSGGGWDFGRTLMIWYRITEGFETGTDVY